MNRNRDQPTQWTCHPFPFEKIVLNAVAGGWIVITRTAGALSEERIGGKCIAARYRRVKTYSTVRQAVFAIKNRTAVRIVARAKFLVNWVRTNEKTRRRVRDAPPREFPFLVHYRYRGRSQHYENYSAAKLARNNHFIIDESGTN